MIFNRFQELFLYLITGKTHVKKFSANSKYKIDMIISLWNPPVECVPVDKKNKYFIYKLIIDYEIKKPSSLEYEIIKIFLDMIS